MTKTEQSPGGGDVLPIQTNGLGNESYGIRQEKKGYKPPSQLEQQQIPNLLNKEMAVAAAKHYKKNQKSIQQACAKIDPSVSSSQQQQNDTKRCCCCNIM